MSLAFKMEGIDELLDRLQNLSSNSVKNIATPVINAGLRVLAEGVKAQVPPQYERLASLVGKRIDKSASGEGQMRITGKVGWGVAKRSGSRARAGVGISSNNIHWLVLGTDKRETKSGASRGVMPAVLADCVPNGVEYSNADAIEEMERVFKELLNP